MVKKIKLTNSFHNTEITVEVPECLFNDDFDYLSHLENLMYSGSQDQRTWAKNTYNGIWKNLCGVRGCTCGVVR